MHSRDGWTGSQASRHMTLARFLLEQAPPCRCLRPLIWVDPDLGPTCALCGRPQRGKDSRCRA